MERLPHFMKHYMTEADLMALLKSRGLVISDEDKAVRYLESIGYYRLSAYMYPFLKVPKEITELFKKQRTPSTENMQNQQKNLSSISRTAIATHILHHGFWVSC